MIVTSKESAARGSDPHLDCTLAVNGWLSVRAAELPAVRSQVATAYAKTLSSGVLKQADEQGLVALLAIHRALEESCLKREEIEDWGLIASARMPGRRRIAESLVKFREQGAWTTSPHIIPHCSLHSMPGLLSQGLHLLGPNIGVGGMLGSEGEAILAALALLHGERLPGVWIVLTGWDKESLNASDLSCQTALLGLQRSTQSAGQPTLRFEMQDQSPPHPALPSQSRGEGRVGGNLSPVTLESIGRTIRGQATSVWRLGEATVTLSFTNARLEAAA